MPMVVSFQQILILMFIAGVGLAITYHQDKLHKDTMLQANQCMNMPDYLCHSNSGIAEYMLFTQDNHWI